MRHLQLQVTLRFQAVLCAATAAAAVAVVPLFAPQTAWAQDTPPQPPTTQPTSPDAPPAAPATTPPATTPPPAAGDNEPVLRRQTEAYNSGLAALKENNLGAAGDAFERTLQIAPGDVMARVLLGYVRLKQERYDDALSALRVAWAQGAALDAKTRAIIQNNMGMAYWNKKDFALALTAYQRAAELDKDYVDARYNLAFALLSQNRAKEAIPHFRQLLSRNPRDPLLHDGLAQCHESLGQWDQAFASYRTAMKLNPKDSSYPLNLGLALLRSDPAGKVAGRREAAVVALKEAMRLNPEGAPPYLQLGLVYIDKKRWREAQDMLRQYVALRPDDFVGQFNLALAYDYSARFDDALRVYDKAEQLQPNDPAPKNNIGRIFFKRKRLDEAVTRFRQALALNDDFVDARNNLALALTEKGEFDAANIEWQKLVVAANNELKATTEPKARSAVYARMIAARAALAENHLKARQYAEAVAEYKRLLKLSPKNIAAMSNLGLALYNTKEYAEALKFYDEIIAAGAPPRATTKTASKTPPPKAAASNGPVVPREQLAIAYNNRGVVLEAMNRRSGALESYKKAVEIQPDYAEAKSNRDRLLAGTAVG